MQGIDFVIDERGIKKAVLIDLEKWGDVWEDFYDILISKQREDEKEISWEDLKQELDIDNKFHD
ncbi:MAG: hypothetical protein GW795_02515 [Cyanobacteria bacterium]|jgi:hypothetical protein|nr:hypothetical protein [Cyanobacteria bacterium CG_2015-16_32_12]NCO76960.1 hypothetical protein [Cyanobacteria bacterium CG_2015-22_32_23]NCQ04315.1 hypothetical protein [Cyanobacteria bacterium CG_2015-09_32_10]NCQ40774.1 hypothetical protein [Cyanobacteria bacterium CG_2015-04_32_10]NCS85033.1 hypothetical protein [Cyanobacteria bacterium CG_2015-02_32_10]